MYRHNNKYAVVSEPAYIEDDVDAEEIQGEAVPDEMEFRTHITKDMFTRSQKAILDIELVASPAELENGAISNVWRLAPHLTKELKQNMAIANRDMAGIEHRAGNLNRCIPLNLRIIQQKNSFPYAMGFEADGMMPLNLHQHGQCLWRVPADTPTQPVKKINVFEPKNIVNKFAYTNFRMCTPEDLVSDIKIVDASPKNKAHANIVVGSLAHNQLIEHLDNGYWADQIDHFNVDHVYEPGRSQTVQVTAAMGEELLASLKKPVDEASKAFLNLEDFNFTIVRADGNASFGSPQGICGEIIGAPGNGAVQGKKLNATRMQTRYVFSVKAELDYLLF